MTEFDDHGLVWALDTAHFPAPVTRWSSALFTTMQTDVVRQQMADSGILLEGVAFQELNGWIYTAVVPIGGRIRKPPPRWAVPIICHTSPTIRRRLAAAHAADVNDHSGRAVEEWMTTKEDDLLERGRGYLAGDLAALTARQVAARLEEQLAFMTECFAWHYRLHGAGADAIGRLGLELTTQHGWSLPAFMDLFTGLSSTTLGPAEAQRAIVDLVAEAGGLAALGRASSLRDVASISPEVSAALAAYRDLWGQRAVRYEVAYPTIVERPEWLLRVLKDTAQTPIDKELAARHEQRRERAEARVPASLGVSSATRRRLARAQRAFPLREGNEAATIGVPIAALRRLGLHIGIRLGLYRPDDIFDLTFEEVLGALRHPDAQADPTPIALMRREEREAEAKKVPDAVLGDATPKADPHGRTGPERQLPVGTPDLRGFPKHAADGLAALLWYEDQVSAPLVRARLADHVLLGLGVSPGTYEGTARIIRDEEDFERIRQGDVVVCPITSPAWSMVFPLIGAIVCDGGGMMSHPAIIAREFELPAVVATGVATETIPDGTRVRVDGAAGRVTLLA